MNITIKEIDEALEAIRRKVKDGPSVAVVLGSGLGALADSIENPVVIPYGEIPHWPESTAPGHDGKLIIGGFGGKSIVAMKGRVHYYEGYSMEQVVFPVRVLARWGIKTYIASNASGGVDYGLAPGDMVLIHDHINLMGDNPLIGPNLDEIGVRFPDMTYAYDPDLLNLAEEVARDKNLTVRRGVYLALAGPSYETPAEIRMARMMGADVVGMSTVPEVIGANHGGMRVLAVSCVANYASGMTSNRLSEEEVLEQMDKSASSLRALVAGVIERI